jgi:radical SAM protein with 4Fe4S-binding SPASM domain
MNFDSLYRTIIAAYATVPKTLFKGCAFPPVHVFIELTRRCNLRCAMCQNLPYMDRMSAREEKEQELTLEELKRVIGATPRFSLLTFTGGEPLVRADLPEILRYASATRRCHLITNGALLDGEMAELMAASAARHLLGKGLVFIGVSIQGPAEVHDRITGVTGCFARVIDGAGKLAAAKAAAGSRLPFLYACVVLTGETVATLPEMPDIAKSISADVLNITLHNTSIDLSIVDGATMETMFKRPGPPDPIEKDLLEAKLAETLRRSAELGIQVRLPRMPISKILDYYAGRWDGSGYTCNTPWTKTFISPHGMVYACHQFETGNVREKSLKEIWNGAEYRRFRQMLKRHKVFPICAGCCEIEYASK